MPASLNSWEEKEKGNAAFKAGDYQLAIRHYSNAIANDIDPGDPLYFTNRAQAYLKVGSHELAEKDCTSALALDPRLSKAYWRRATARKESSKRAQLSGAIEDYRTWLTHATAEGKADPASKSVMDANVREIEAMLRGDIPLPKPPAPAPTATSAPNTTTADPPSSSKLRKGALPPGRSDPALQLHLDKIHKAHQSLVELWDQKSGQAITVWKDIVDLDVRKAKIESGVAGVKPKKNYPELKPSSLATSDNLLDFISSRASTSHDPCHFAHHLDLPRAQVVRVQTGASTSGSSGNALSRMSTGSTPPTAGKPASYILLVDQVYGQVVDVDVNDSAQLETRRKVLEKGDACEREEGEEMLERQVVCYEAALRLLGMLVKESGEEDGDWEGEVDEEGVRAYEEQVKNKEYTGREEYSLERVTAIVQSSRAYAEDHLEFLREDADYVSEHILDRMPSAVPITATDMIDLLGKEELLEMFLNGFARQTLWKEVLNVIDAVKAMAPELGAGKPIPQPYQRKIGLLAKLVEAFINLTFKELTASVEKSFEAEFKAMRSEEEGPDSFTAFLDMMAEISGYAPPAPRTAARPRQTRRDPLASMFKALIKLDPQQMPKQTWEIIACLNELKGLFDRQPEQKQRLSRRLVEALGEYTEVIELREILLDSHRPRFSRDWSERSSFLTQLGPLWQQLERCWSKSISPSMIGKVVRQKTPASLTAIWTKFEGEVQKQLKVKPGVLFDKLLSKNVEAHSTRFVVNGGQTTTTPAVPRPRAASAGDDSDGPPGLEEDSDGGSSGPPSLYASDDDDDSDVPPALYAASSSDDDPDMPGLESEHSSDGEDYTFSDDELYAPSGPGARPPPRRQPPARRPQLPIRRPPRQRPARPPRQPVPEPQPGPSHSTQRPARPAVDMSGLRPDHEFGTRDGIRPASPTGDEVDRPRRKEKKKTRKERDETMLAAELAGMNTEEMSSATETDTETEGQAFPSDLRFPVSEKVYATFEQYIGIGPHISRTEVAWVDFLQAMRAIHFHPVHGAGSSWKFYPRGRIAGNVTMSLTATSTSLTLRRLSVLIRSPGRQASQEAVWS
ncbi:hypothetical protein BCR35DRAFT_304029 [Leucosporidium creatinivorum]|uniref:Uncharacterized protein n=1 Tax=Leucosporidium creatinivorum TaxID=106004 RepID=A0A1Y2FD50_9BASI|nr:hypothetical protein BCR35DRAFT_304029 [Leucosporidium creatinivorum]